MIPAKIEVTFVSATANKMPENFDEDKGTAPHSAQGNVWGYPTLPHFATIVKMSEKIANYVNESAKAPSREDTVIQIHHTLTISTCQ